MVQRASRYRALTGLPPPARQRFSVTGIGGVGGDIAGDAYVSHASRHRYHGADIVPVVKHHGRTGCQDEAVIDSETEKRLLENVLDALDDLYDRRERAEWWTERLLLATSVAFHGTRWERPMAEAATSIDLSLRGAGTYGAKNTAALVATGDLRLQVARAL
jgi:hypothetical protein